MSSLFSTDDSTKKRYRKGVLTTVTFFIFVFLAFQNVSTLAQVTGYVAEYHFDEGSGDSVADSTGVNNGWLGSSVGPSTSDPLWTTGRVGSALSFDGSNDRVTIPDSPSLNITGAVTIELWVNSARAVSGLETFVAKGNNTTAMNYYFG
ncbi:MAG: hypothetical protein HYT34_02090, partial [Candidatus Ryanbacteria bacterium]|nr:hypothetical protein [Candidatus Ryanbacteria bacterium]